MKQPTPKMDALRAMREANYARTHPTRRSIAALKETVAAIPVKRAPKIKRGKGKP
jgi:hypothetical protein